MDRQMAELREKGLIEPDIEKVEAHENRQADRLNRSLSTRQLQMMSLAGVIGTGLYLGTGQSLAEGGPASLLLGYVINGAIVYLVMLALAEMAAYMPVAGSVCTFSGRFVDPALGFAITWNYWFKCALGVATELVALQIVFEYWTDFPSWAIALIFWVFMIVLNIAHVKAFGEIEYWMSILKIATIIVFIILGIVVNCGVNQNHQYLGFKYWGIGEAPFVNKLRGFVSVFLNSAFAYSGTESVAISAGEARNPARNMPKVAKAMFYRIIFFYVLTVLIIGINIPYNYPNLSTGDTTTSPFTLVFEQAGSKVAGSFVNAVIVTSIISATNHSVYVAVRLFYTLGTDGYAPKFFAALTPQRVPWVGVVATGSVSGLCFGASFIGSGTLFAWLQHIVGVCNQICWVVIGITSIRFRKAIHVQNKDYQLNFRNWTYPWGPWIVVVIASVIVLIQGWTSFSPWNTSDFFSVYLELLVIPTMYVAWKLWFKTKIRIASEIDLETDRYISTNDDLAEMEYEDSFKGWRKAVYTLKTLFV